MVCSGKKFDFKTRVAIAVKRAIFENCYCIFSTEKTLNAFFSHYKEIINETQFAKCKTNVLPLKKMVIKMYLIAIKIAKQ